MTSDTIGIRHRFGQRLLPLAVLVGILISMGAPAVYYALGLRVLSDAAARDARMLARTLPSADASAVARAVSQDGTVVGIRLLDARGDVVSAWRAPDATWTWGPTRRASASTTDRVAQIVEVTVSEAELIRVTLLTLLVSTLIGAGVALVMYTYPVRVIVAMEGRVDDTITRQEHLLEASRLLASTLDLREVLDRLTEMARTLPAIDIVRIWLEDEHGDGLSLISEAGLEHDREDVPQMSHMGRGQGLVSLAMAGGRPVVLNDALTSPSLVNRAWMEAKGFSSFLGIPLRIGDRTLGVLACFSRTSRERPRMEIALAETLGTLAAVAIRNARTFGEMRRRGERLQHATELARLVSGALELDVILQQVVAAVVALGDDLRCVIRLVDPDAGGYRLAAAGGVGEMALTPVIPFGAGLTSAVAETRAPVLSSNPSQDPRCVDGGLPEIAKLVYYGVPIEAADTVFGVLNVYVPHGVPPTASECEAIELFAGHAAIAIRNARLFGESDARRRAAEALAEVGRALAQALDPDVVGRHITESIQTLLGATTSALYRLDPSSGSLTALAVAGAGQSSIAPGMTLPRGTGVVGLAVLSRQPVATPNSAEDPRVTLTPELREAALRTSGSVLAVPLVVKEQVIGALGMGDHAGRVFDADEIRLAQAFADQAALSLENARLYEEATRRRHEAEELARVARTLTESLDVTQVGERIVARVIPLFGAHSSGLMLLSSDQSLRAVAWGGHARRHFPADQVFPPGVGVAGRAVAWGAPFQTRDVLDDPAVVMTAETRAHIEAAGDRAILSVPLHAKGELIGVLSITDGRPRAFSNAEIALLQSFADQAALALENARLYQNAQRAYEEVSATQAQLVRGETLRAMGELASGVAHHLNNLLAVVLGRVQLARGRHPSPDVERHLQVAERAATDGAEVVRRLSGFGRAHPVPDLAPVDLNRIAEDVVELTRPRWQDEAQMRGVHIDVVMTPGEIRAVPGDVASLREVLMNLILNAIDALPRGGRIGIRTWTSDQSVYCEVADSGVGMSPEVHRRALEPFFTTKGFQSTGLGLSVNYGIVRRHGGDLTIQSEIDRGTKVTVSLPLAASPHPQGDGAVVGTRSAPLRILVIDDETQVRDVISEILANQGHDVVQVPGGREALAVLEEDHDFDLVLTDLGMPGMTGWEVARAAKLLRPSIRVGLITGWRDETRVKPDELGGVDFVLAKPLTMEALRSALAQIPRRA